MAQKTMHTDGGPMIAGPVTVAPVHLPPARPEWIRLPRSGTPCGWTGLSRSTLWGILQSGKVRTVVIRRPGNLRGARLIHLESLLAYLESLTVEAVPTGAEDEIETGKGGAES